MPTSIRHLVEKLKSFITDDGFYMATLLILVSVASFGLGRQSIIESEPIETLENKSSVIMTEFTKSVPNLAPESQPIIVVAESVSEDVIAEGEVVASKSGKKYHLPTCSGAKSIKPENLVTFATPAEAEAAGYTPAANCKGLQ